MNFGPVVPSAGPRPARIALVAEAPGEEESTRLTPLVGPSGYELRRMLSTIGVNLDDCFKCNVFSRQPPNSDLSAFCTPEPSRESRSLGPLLGNPQLWIRDEFLVELERLRAELIECRPNVVVALGNTASWALLGSTGINTLRGSVHVSRFLGDAGPALKVIPTYHPAAVLRQWDQRVIAIADLEKAHAESHTPDVSYDNTELWLDPSLNDLYEFGERFMANATICATDVETKRGQIDCISFAPRPDIAISVPFWCRDDGSSYWPDPQSEHTAWAWVRRWIESPTLTKVMQNGSYDIQYMRRHGMNPRACTEDTMLAHHSLYSELRKGLGFLGSVYANRPGWKSMASFKKEEQLKRDD